MHAFWDYSLTNLHHVCCMVTLSCLNYGLQTESFNLNDIDWGFSWKWHCKLRPIMEMCCLNQYTEKCLCYRHPWNQNVILVGKLLKCTNGFCTFSSLLIYNYWGVFNSGCSLKMVVGSNKEMLWSKLYISVAWINSQMYNHTTENRLPFMYICYSNWGNKVKTNISFTYWSAKATLL